WLDGYVQVGGVEADDYPTSAALLSRLRRAGRATVRTLDDMPPGYDGFEIVQHRAEIDAPYSPVCLAVKIAEGDQERWALHAWLRSTLPRTKGAASASVPAPQPTDVLPAASSPNGRAVAQALLAHANQLADSLTGDGANLT